MKTWYALYVNVRHEKKVALKLLEKGIETYVPMVTRMKQWSDRKKMQEFPLISGYIFASLSPNEMDQPRFVPGVVNYVRFGGKPAAIRETEIEGLKYFVDNGYELEELQGEEIKIGDKISAVVIASEGEGGQALLSMKKAGGEMRWQVMTDKMNKSEAGGLL